VAKLAGLDRRVGADRLEQAAIATHALRWELSRRLWRLERALSRLPWRLYYFAANGQLRDGDTECFGQPLRRG